MEKAKAISIVFYKDNKVLLFRRTGTKQTHAGLWSLPSTYIIAGESPTKAAQRLVKRKLGISKILLEDTPIGEFIGIHNENKRQFQMTDYVVLHYEGEIKLNPSEYSEMKWVHFGDLEDFLFKENDGKMGHCCKVLIKNIKHFKE